MYFYLIAALASAIGVGVVASGSSATGTIAGTTPTNVSVASVPEIDASSGLLALAAVLAVIAFTWERNRRLRG